MPPPSFLFEFDYSGKKYGCNLSAWRESGLGWTRRPSGLRVQAPTAVSGEAPNLLTRPRPPPPPPSCPPPPNPHFAPSGRHTYGKKSNGVSTGRPCQVWIPEHLAAYLGTLEPCVDTHRTVSYIAWSYRGQERSGGTEALQMFFISRPQGKSVTATPGSFCSERRHSAAVWLRLRNCTHTPLGDCTTWTWTLSCESRY